MGEEEEDFVAGEKDLAEGGTWTTKEKCERDATCDNGEISIPLPKAASTN
jgi:hypothetical protein